VSEQHGNGPIDDAPDGGAPAAGVLADGERAGSRRVFFALWPDDDTRKRLVRATRDAVRRSGGRPTPKDRLHTTVAFLGSLTEAGLEIARGVPPVRVGPFDWTLDMIGTFDHARTLWVGAQSTPRPLADLERQLWGALETRGFVRERRIYRPHVTLARRARSVADSVDGVPWHVAELALVESLPDGRNVHYEVLQTWPL
jgi:RNA 2',3'-cyclic 3'-phosphodiesterase